MKYFIIWLIGIFSNKNDINLYKWLKNKIHNRFFKKWEITQTTYKSDMKKASFSINNKSGSKTKPLSLRIISYFNSDEQRLIKLDNHYFAFFKDLSDPDCKTLILDPNKSKKFVITYPEINRLLDNIYNNTNSGDLIPYFKMDKEWTDGHEFPPESFIFYFKDQFGKVKHSMFVSTKMG